MTTLNELAQLFGFSDNDQKDFHVWGKVVSVSGTKATVSLNASQVNVTCVKCEPCKAGDRVLVLIMSSGQAIIVGNATTRQYWFEKPVLLWSGTLSKGGTVTISELNRYSNFGVMLKGCSGLYTGTLCPDSYICCSGTMDQGSSVEIRSARFRKTSSTTLLLDYASKLVGTTRTEMQVSSIYGLL